MADAGDRLARDARALLVDRGLIAPDATLVPEALGGGVSSTLLRLRTADDRRSWCAKRPLTRLRVAGDWQVSPDRSASEARWLATVGRWYPDAVPSLVAHDEASHLIVMEDLAPPHWRCWKPDLLEGRVEPAFGARLGRLLGAIQLRSERQLGLADDFDNAPLFHALRLRPFLLATAEAHPDRAAQLRMLAEDFRTEPATLVHGDVSPKNVLVHDDQRLVLLDAECACWGGAHFDPAFFLSHLLLKWAHRPEAAGALRTLADAFRDAWLTARSAEPNEAIDRRCTRLLPALLLARIDGLSPVDYLPAERAARIRSFARSQLQVSPEAFPVLLERYARAMGDID